MNEAENGYYLAGLTTGIVIGLLYIHEGLTEEEMEISQIRSMVEDIMRQVPQQHERINNIVSKVIEND